MNEEKQKKYLQMLNEFYLEHQIKSGQRIDKMPELAQKIIIEIKKEQGLTYDEAYIALECAYRYLKMESIFVPVYRE